jgi:glycosyltransferase involved in cell wall biosynthesis
MEREKNILFITNVHLWSLDKGKGGRAFINTVEGYRNAGWTVWFISTGGGIPENTIDLDKLFENSSPKLENLWRSGIRVVSVFARFLKMAYLIHYYYRQGYAILSTNKSKKFVIYAYEADSVVAAKILSRKFRKPLVTRFQGTKHNKTPDNLINLIRKAPNLQAYKTRADLVIMTNDGTQGLKTLHRLGNKSNEIVFWRNGVNTVPMELINQREQFRKQFNFVNFFTFLTVSRLVSWKRVDRAINAFAIVNKVYPDTRLVILGDGEAKQDLMSLTERLGINLKVVFVGAVEQKVVCNYMVAADAFLSFYDLSNVGNPLLEAMMCGKAIITLDVGDTGELIVNNKNGILLSMDQLENIPEMMLKIIDDSALAERIGAGALKTARSEFWSWEERMSIEISKVEKLLD